MELLKIFNYTADKFNYGSCPKLLESVLAIVLSALSFYLSTEYWCFSWIALFLLCIYSLKNSLIITFMAGFVSSFLGSANPHAILPIVIYWPLIMFNAIGFAGVLAIFRLIADKWKGWNTSLIFASGLTAQEFVFSLYSPHGTVSSIAYTQTSNLPIVQIASVTGIWGISFLMALITANIALLFRYSQNRGIKTNLIPTTLLIAVIIFGLYRLNTPGGGEKIKVGIAATPINLEQYLVVVENKNKEQVDDIVQRYIRKINLLAKSGAEVILLPEKIISIENKDNFKLFSDAARKNNINLIVGVISKESNKTYNSAYVFSKAGEEILQYNKQHLQTTFEKRYTSGDTLGLTGKWGIEVCKDMDFIRPSLEYSQKGVNIVFVPALDFHDDAWSHARVAIMRGIEGDFAVARAGQWGLLTLSDSRGRIIEAVSCDIEQDDAILTQEVLLGRGNSIYSKIGDSFGWVCSGMFIALSTILFFIKPIECV